MLKLHNMRWTVAVAVLLLSACGSGPAPKLYLLEPIVDEQQQRTPTLAKDIGLAVVKVPGYADDQLIASRVGGTRVVVSDEHQWAEDPDAAITRVLANRIDFDKLLRDERGGAEVAGQLRIISGDGKEVLSVKSFQVVHESGGMAQADFFTALSRAINDIARLATFTLLNGETAN